MPTYKFICYDCQVIQDLSMSISDYTNNKIINYNCIICGSNKLMRKYGIINSQVQLDKQDELDLIREEVRTTIEKIRNGDSSVTADIYGEEVNQLKY